MENVNYVLGGILDEALGVDFEQRPADVADVVLDSLEVSRLLGKASRGGLW